MLGRYEHPLEAAEAMVKSAAPYTQISDLTVASA
jgi:hypothetical protein